MKYLSLCVFLCFLLFTFTLGIKICSQQDNKHSKKQNTVIIFNNIMNDTFPYNLGLVLKSSPEINEVFKKEFKEIIKKASSTLYYLPFLNFASNVSYNYENETITGVMMNEHTGNLYDINFYLFETSKENITQFIEEINYKINLNKQKYQNVTSEILHLADQYVKTSENITILQNIEQIESFEMTLNISNKIVEEKENIATIQKYLNELNYNISKETDKIKDINNKLKYYNDTYDNLTTHIKELRDEIIEKKRVIIDNIQQYRKALKNITKEQSDTYDYLMEQIEGNSNIEKDFFEKNVFFINNQVNTINLIEIIKKNRGVLQETKNDLEKVLAQRFEVNENIICNLAELHSKKKIVNDLTNIKEINIKQIKSINNKINEMRKQLDEKEKMNEERKINAKVKIKKMIIDTKKKMELLIKQYFDITNNKNENDKLMKGLQELLKKTTTQGLYSILFYKSNNK